jgi:hypothetical protein
LALEKYPKVSVAALKEMQQQLGKLEEGEPLREIVLERVVWTREAVDEIVRWGKTGQWRRALLKYADASLEELKATVERHAAVQVVTGAVRRAVEKERKKEQAPGEVDLGRVAQEYGVGLDAVEGEYKRQCDRGEEEWSVGEEEKLVVWMVVESGEGASQEMPRLKIGRHSEGARRRRWEELKGTGLEAGLFDDLVLRVATRLMRGGQVPWSEVVRELTKELPGVNWEVEALERRFEALKGLQRGRGWPEVGAGVFDDRLREVWDEEVPELMKLSAELRVSPVRLWARVWDVWAVEPGTWSVREQEKLRARVEWLATRGKWTWPQVAEVFAGRRTGDACRAHWTPGRWIADPELGSARPARRGRPKEGPRRLWTKDENARLHKLVWMHPEDWRQMVEAAFPGRTKAQVLRHWQSERKQPMVLGRADKLRIMRRFVECKGPGVFFGDVADDLNVPEEVVTETWESELWHGGVGVWADVIAQYVAEKGRGTVPRWGTLVSMNEREVEEAFLGPEEGTERRWTAEDDGVLLVAVRQYGFAWVEIGRDMDRSAYDVARRWELRGRR